MNGGIHLVGSLALLAAASLGAMTAEAVPIVYTFTGRLMTLRGGDFLRLDGATLTVVVAMDTDAIPAGTSSGATRAEALHRPMRLTATFSDRPGGAPDENVAYQPSYLLLQNLFSESDEGLGDALVLAGGQARLGIWNLVMPQFRVEFESIEFFAGTGIPSLPIFEPNEVHSIPTTEIRPAFGPPPDFRYRVSASVQVVYEPDAGLLFLGALGLLALRAHR
jgi:hypothetical protein